MQVLNHWCYLIPIGYVSKLKMSMRSGLICDGGGSETDPELNILLFSLVFRLGYGDANGSDLNQCISGVDLFYSVSHTRNLKSENESRNPNHTQIQI